MFTVKTPEEAAELLRESFCGVLTGVEDVPIEECAGRICAGTIRSTEYVPGFNRSTVDGYAVRASETFGASESMPALLGVVGEVSMGEGFSAPLSPGECAAIPTGGFMPENTDTAVMLEYTEDYGDGTIGIIRPSAPGENVIYRGDDVKPGDILLKQGAVIFPHDVGGLAALGMEKIAVRKKTAVGIISTGDELVPVGAVPRAGQVRDVNTSMLYAAVLEAGGAPLLFGTVRDDRELLRQTVQAALSRCDVLLISGGSSVGMKDSTAAVIEEMGEILFHGIAIKPGKPTIAGKAGNRAIFGLPGHPAAAHYITRIFVRPLIARMMGAEPRSSTVTARLTEAVPSNHGRAECISVNLQAVQGEMPIASPIHGKSGLITALAGADGYFIVPRDCEGIPKGGKVTIVLY